MIGIEIKIPMKGLKRTSESFLQWRDEFHNAWGLNFVCERDLKRFYKICKPKLPPDSQYLFPVNSSSLPTHSKHNSLVICEKSNKNENQPAIRKSLIPNIRVEKHVNSIDLDEDGKLQDSLETQSSLSSQKSYSLTNVNTNLDDNDSMLEEDFQHARPASAIVVNRHIMTTRKAAWLLVKHMLLVTKKGKLELSSNRKWRKYWVALKGVEMMFYNADEKISSVSDMNDSEFVLDVEWCIVQSVPEYARLENVFSLSSCRGNAYYFQSTSQTEVENWIHCIHSSCASVYARKKSFGNVRVLLDKEIYELNGSLISDEKLRKMAVLQLKTEKELQAKERISEQIASWENCLESQYCTVFKLQCYSSAVNGKPLPNPQGLLSHTSRRSKSILSKIGILSVTSFHSLLSSAKFSEHEKLKPKSKSLKSRLMSSLKLTEDDNNNDVVEMRKSPLFCKKTFFSDGSNSTKSLQKSRMSDRSDDITLHVQISDLKQSIRIPWEDNLKTCELLERVCMREELDSTDYFIVLYENQDSYTVPNYHDYLHDVEYLSITLQKKLVYTACLCNPADHQFGSFGMKLVQIEDCVIVSHVEEGSPAKQEGICVHDELLEINGYNWRKIKSSFDEIVKKINSSTSVTMKLRSKRVYDPKKTDQATDSMINFLVCPPPPKCQQEELTDDNLNKLIVPAPFDFDLSKSHISSSSFVSSGSNLSNDEDIDQFLKNTEEVNMLTRDMQGIVSVVPTSMKPCDKLRKAILELIDTERSYKKNLKVLLERYLLPMKEEKFLSTDEMDSLLSTVRDIYVSQTAFFERLKDILQSERDMESYAAVNDYQNIVYQIGELFLEFCDKFRLYSTFCSCHSRAVKMLQTNGDEDLKAFLHARNPNQQHTCSLESYLITPIQRILRYPLLMKTMLKYIQQESDEYACMSNALEGVKRVADFINEMQRINETFTPVFHQVAKRYNFLQPGDLVVDNILHYGRVQWLNCPEKISRATTSKTTEENMTVFVFKKALVLIICDMKQSTGKKSNGNNICDNVDVKFSMVLDTRQMLLRDHAWADNATSQAWEIVEVKNQQEEDVFQFVNRTSEEKKVLVNAIKETKKFLSESSTNTSLLQVSKKPNVMKIPSFTRKDSNRSSKKEGSRFEVSPRLTLKFGCRVRKKST